MKNLTKIVLSAAMGMGLAGCEPYMPQFPHYEEGQLPKTSANYVPKTLDFSKITPCEFLEKYDGEKSRNKIKSFTERQRQFINDVYAHPERIKANPEAMRAYNEFIKIEPTLSAKTLKEYLDVFPWIDVNSHKFEDEMLKATVWNFSNFYKP